MMMIRDEMNNTLLTPQVMVTHIE